ncbi:MAG: hypothetical protein JKY80_00800 [Mariprofundaceae bacterium]|nr:hypothetical protein [Mariprofundaceae bacterium]PCH52072.1 MAG: hypothetical protein COC22_04675 [Flavobacteriaceae bacterium]
MPEQDSFHLKREITWGHLLTTVFLFGSIVGLYEDNNQQHLLADKRITVVEMQIKSEHEQGLLSRSEMRDRLQSIDTKLDRLLDRMIDK